MDENFLSDPHLGSPGCIKDEASFLEAPNNVPGVLGASDGEKRTMTMTWSPPLENSHSSQVERELDHRNTA